MAAPLFKSKSTLDLAAVSKKPCRKVLDFSRVREWGWVSAVTSPLEPKSAAPRHPRVTIRTLGGPCGGHGGHWKGKIFGCSILFCTVIQFLSHLLSLILKLKLCHCCHFYYQIPSHFHTLGFIYLEFCKCEFTQVWMPSFHLWLMVKYKQPVPCSSEDMLSQVRWKAVGSMIHSHPSLSLPSFKIINNSYLEAPNPWCGLILNCMDWEFSDVPECTALDPLCTSVDIVSHSLPLCMFGNWASGINR
jgi:hypothetical protein